MKLDNWNHCTSRFWQIVIFKKKICREAGDGSDQPGAELEVSWPPTVSYSCEVCTSSNAFHWPLELVWIFSDLKVFLTEIFGSISLETSGPLSARNYLLQLLHRSSCYIYYVCYIGYKLLATFTTFATLATNYLLHWLQLFHWLQTTCYNCYIGY